MQHQVVQFDKLRKAMKYAKSNNKIPTPLLMTYNTASEELKQNLINEYRESKRKLMATSIADSTEGVDKGSTIQHKINVLKRVLLHEWKLTLDD